MNKYIFLFILSIAYFASSCSNDKSEKNTGPANDYNYNITTDTLAISKKECAFLLGTSYNDSLMCVFRKIGESKLCIAKIHNKTLVITHTFPLADTSLFTVRKDKNMQESINFQRVFIINYDTLIFFNRGQSNEISSRILWIYETNKDKVQIFDSFESPNYYEKNAYDNIKEPYFYDINMKWNPTKQCLFSRFINIDTSGCQNRTDSFLIEIYPFDHKREILPMTFVADTGKNSIYPYWDRIHPCVDNMGNYFIAFGASSMIYSFDKKLHKTDLKHPNYSEPLAYTYSKVPIGSDFVRIGCRTFAYTNLIYDKFNNCFYRLYEMEMPERTPEGLKSVYPNDKKFGLNVISHDLSSIKEVIIDKKDNFMFFKDYFQCVTKNGIEHISFDNKTGKLLHVIFNINLTE